nr:redoxin domain-containing protein [Asgard group archaeon]
VVLDFMSVTCEPCKQLMPELKEISEDFNDTVVILSIDVDLSDNESQLLDFKNTYNATWAFALDTAGLQDLYTVIQIPKTVIINSEGYITFSEIGLAAGGDLREYVEDTLAGIAEPISATVGFSIFTALAAGILSFFSPCAFPLLPGYMAYNLDLLIRDEAKDIETIKQEKTKIRLRKRFGKSLAWGSYAALGIVLFYMIIGIVVASLSQITAERIDQIAEAAEYISYAVAGLLIILGIITLTPVSLDMSKAITAVSNLGKKKKQKTEEENKEGIEGELNGKEKKKRKQRDRIARELPYFTQLFLYGITYALASIGCNLPILLGLVFSAFQTGGFTKAILIFLVYSLAMGLLMIIITMLVGLSKDTLINRLQASTKVVKILSGILLIIAGGFLMGYTLWERYRS